MKKNYRNQLRLYLAICCLCLISLHAEENQTPTTDKKYTLSLCTIFYNETNHLKEWIEYHRLIGVDHFYLYNVESTDNYKEILSSYINEKIVTLIQWPNLSKNHEDNPLFLMLGTRIPALENAAKYQSIHDTVWLSFVDVDEFLVPPTGTTLIQILQAYEAYPAITLPSDFFDASTRDFLSDKKLVIENLNLSKPYKQTPEKTIKKIIFKPDQVKGFTWPPYNLIFKDGKTEIVLQKGQLQINHYTNRDSSNFFNRKVKDKLLVNLKTLEEGEKNYLLERFEIQDFEQPIIRFAPDVRKKMGITSVFDYYTERN